MAQAIETFRGERFGAARTERTGSLVTPNLPETRFHDVTDDPAVRGLGLSRVILAALGDESSRKILTSAISSGKTVEEISAEQNLPLSTCYRRMRTLLAGGLMILERTVVTPAGKRYAIYRTSFSRASISFLDGDIAVELTPNMDIIDKLRRKWLSDNYPPQSEEDRMYKGSPTYSGLVTQSSAAFG